METRKELVQFQMKAARDELIFKEDEHRLKMEHLANDEKRKQEIHALLIQKLNCASTTTSNMLYDNNV